METTQHSPGTVHAQGQGEKTSAQEEGESPSFPGLTGPSRAESALLAGFAGLTGRTPLQLSRPASLISSGPLPESGSALGQEFEVEDPPDEEIRQLYLSTLARLDGELEAVRLELRALRESREPPPPEARMSIDLGAKVPFKALPDPKPFGVKLHSGGATRRPGRATSVCGPLRGCADYFYALLPLCGLSAWLYHGDFYGNGSHFDGPDAMRAYLEPLTSL